jgi:hexulose-6-phosphate isomerase
VKKSINLWAFPYPGQWPLKRCLEIAKDAGFEGIELNIDLDGELSVQSTPAQLMEIRRLAEAAGIEISGICSFLFWPYSMTSNDCDRRAKGIEMAESMIDSAGVFLNIENIFMNGFLFSPQEIRDFVDSFGSRHVRVHFDTGNISEYQFPEHWIPILGERIQNVHLKEWDRRSREFACMRSAPCWMARPTGLPSSRN